MTKTLQAKTALVTGASSGMGVDFARELAQRGCNLILVARREEKLREVQEELSKQYGVEVAVIPIDLAETDAPQRLYDEIKSQGKAVDVLVNNAGFGIFGEFTEVPWTRQKQMLDIDIIALTHLTKLFIQDMLARDYGYILLVSSIGAYLPSPTYATYSASKRFVLDFGEALNFELRKTNVSCTVLSPGVTKSEFHQVAGQELTLFQRMTMIPSAKAARSGVKAMLKGKPSVASDWMTALSAFCSASCPAGWPRGSLIG